MKNDVLLLLCENSDEHINEGHRKDKKLKRCFFKIYFSINSSIPEVNSSIPEDILKVFLWNSFKIEIAARMPDGHSHHFLEKVGWAPGHHMRAP